MPLSLEDIDREIARRQSSLGTQAAPGAGGGLTVNAIDAEIARRQAQQPNVQDVREGATARGIERLGEQREPGFIDYVPGAGVIQDIPDIMRSGFNAPPIQARRERREKAAKTLVPYAASAAGASLATPVAGPATLAGFAGRAALSGLGAAGGDVAGQAVTQGGQVDPRQTAAAAAGGAIGQPIGEALGAAVPAGVRALLRGGEGGRRGVQASIDDAARFGEVPTVAQATSNSFLDGVEGLLAKTPGSAGRFRDRITRTTANVRRNLLNIAQQGGDEALDAEGAGRAIIEGVEGFTERFRQRSNRLFDRVVAEIGEATPVRVTNTSRVLGELTDPVLGAEQVSERFTSPFIRGLADDLAADVADNGMMPVAALRRVRSLVGERLGNPMLVNDVPRSQLNRLYGALSDDIRDAATAAGANARRSFDIANRFYRTRLGHIERNLEPMIRNRAPERVFDALVSGARSGPTQIRNVYRSLNTQQQDAVTGAVIRRMGTAPAGQQGAEGAEFSFSTFLTRWNQMDEAARNAVFNRGRYAQMGQDINALARYSERVRDSSRAFFNPSGTSGATIGGTVGLLSAGSIAASPFLGTGALTLPLIFGAGAGAANVGARMMTSPRVVHWLAQATRVRPQGAPAHLSRLAALMPKENEEVQAAIGDYFDMLQSPIGQANAEPLQSGSPAPMGPPQQPAAPPVDLSGIEGQLQAQGAQQAQIMQMLQQQPQAAPQAGPAPQEIALREREMEMRQIEAANQLELQRQGMERQNDMIQQQIEMMRMVANGGGGQAEGQPKKRKAKKAKFVRDGQGRIIGAEVDGRKVNIVRDEMGRFVAAEFDGE